jgi:transcriptional regulator with XRE-family HTH domain
MTLADLAGEIGVSQQQVQKYESGASRVSASTLVALAEVLNVPIQDLFAGARPKQPIKLTKTERARMECRALVERTRSLPKLKSMAKVLKAMSGD